MEVTVYVPLVMTSIVAAYLLFLVIKTLIELWP